MGTGKKEARDRDAPGNKLNRTPGERYVLMWWDLDNAHPSIKDADMFRAMLRSVQAMNHEAQELVFGYHAAQRLQGARLADAKKAWAKAFDEVYLAHPEQIAANAGRSGTTGDTGRKSKRRPQSTGGG